MKDFYDIFFFAQKSNFASNDLLDAIKLTFNNRETDLSSRALVCKDNFKADKQKQTQWTAFFKKNKLEAEKNFESVVEKIKNFLEPIFELKQNKKWNPLNWRWE